MAGGGKLTWRVDWPARWAMLGVTVEPFGKDHATRGGSYDTGARIAREVFDYEPPLPVPYEWISLKGQGDMSSSKGNVLSIGQALELVPPEALRYLVMRERRSARSRSTRGSRSCDSSTRSTTPRPAERIRARWRFHAPAASPRSAFRSSTWSSPRRSPGSIADRTIAVLARTGYTGLDRAAIASRLGYARRWLDRHAPDDIKFEVKADASRRGGRIDRRPEGVSRASRRGARSMPWTPRPSTS